MNPAQRLCWDDGVASYTEVTCPSPHIQIANVISKGKMNFKNRDFLEKRVHFEREGVFYIYISFVPDHIKPAPKDNQRAKSIFGVFKIEAIKGGKGGVRMQCSS